MHRSVAIVIADTDCHALAFNALYHSVSSFDFQQVIIFSDKPEAWPGYSIIHIDPINSIEDYNLIITKKLSEELKCDYAIVIQFDGFIINPKEWSPLFFHYDYIGAPWPNYDVYDVGNGGFSLRSRRLIESVANIKYYEISEPEDLFICRRLRPELEALGVRFASREIASYFSVEYPSVPWPTFGFHGIFHLPDIYKNSLEFLIENISYRVAKNRWNFLAPALKKISPHYFLQLQNKLKSDFLL